MNAVTTATAPARVSATPVPGKTGDALAWAILLSIGLGSVTATVAMTGGLESIARYAFVVPIVSGAVLFGFTGGLVTAAAAVLLYAPFVLPSIERYGMTPAAAEGLVAFVILLLVGLLTGALMTWVRRERQRYETVLEIGRAHV